MSKQHRGSEDPPYRKSSISASLLVLSTSNHPMAVALGEKYWHQGWSTAVANAKIATFHSNVTKSVIFTPSVNFII